MPPVSSPTCSASRPASEPYMCAVFLWCIINTTLFCKRRQVVTGFLVRIPGHRVLTHELSKCAVWDTPRLGGECARDHARPQNRTRRMEVKGNEVFIFAIALLVGIAGFCLVGLIQEEVERRNVRAQLRAPLLLNEGGSSEDAIERRVQVAVREARLGFRVCEQCDFTNPRRNASCVICGAKLGEEGDKKARNKPTQSASLALSWRQKRVKKRKEWSRRVQEDGTVVWHHKPIDQGREFPAYVLQTMPDISIQELPNQVEGGEEEQSGNDLIEIVVPSEATLAQTATDLQNELKQTVVSVVEALNADPTQPAFSTAATDKFFSHQEIKDTINSSREDFPTKLAQFITSSSTIFLNATSRQCAESPSENESRERKITHFSVKRESLLTDSVDAIATMTQIQARGAIRVDFVGEHGIDAGGVYREWFLLINEKILEPSAGIFVCVDPQDQAFYLNPQSREVLGDNHLAHFLAAGRLLGRSLLEGNVTGFHLALPLLKIILGLPVGFTDLEYFDPEAYKNLQWLLENDDVDMLGLDFTVVEKLEDGTTRVVELVPGGSDIDVIDENKHEFVDRKFRYLLFESVSEQLFAFLKGLYEVVPVELLMLFDAEELDYVLSGSDEIDVDDWERNTITSKNLVDHVALANFWTSVRSLSTEDRRRLLQFATGATRVPPGGFSALTSYDGRLCRFTLKGVLPERTRGYIRSHACFNRLDLPMHMEAREMRFALAAALSNRSFGFTTA